MKINILDILLSLGAVPSPKTLYSKYRRVNIPFNPNEYYNMVPFRVS